MTATTNGVDNLDAALGYAQAGLEIFPADPASKAPLGEFAPEAFRSATSDAETVRRWWQARPDALIACRIPADVVVIDVDPRHAGDDVIDALEAAFGPLPKTRTHWSGRGDGGCHLWFQRPAGKLKQTELNRWATINGVGELLPARNGRQRVLEVDGVEYPLRQSGLDLLHHGLRYSILPPSLHPDTGRPYEWSDTDVGVAELPAWALELLVEPDQPTPPSSSSSGSPLPAAKAGTRLDLGANGVPAGEYAGDSVADWFTETTAWSTMLAGDGWRLVTGDGDSDGSRWRHPTATASWSATVRHGCLFVYSPTPGLPVTEPGDTNGLTPFRYFAETRHAGDQSAAAKDAMGLPGAPKPPPRVENGLGPARNHDGAESPPQLEQAATSILPIYWGAEIGKLPPPVPLVEGLLDEAAFGVVYGPPGSGKSFWAMSMALHMTSGQDTFHGRRIVNPGSTVAYLAAEGVSGLGRRQAAWCEHHGIEVDDVGRLAWVPSTVDLRTTQSLVELIDLIERTEAALLVIDTLNRNAPGTDEGAQDMGLIVNTVDHLRAQCPRLTVLIVHHTGKDSAKGSRGHSSLLGAVDTEISVAPLSGGLEVKVTKQKEGPRLGPWTFGLEKAGDSVALSATMRSSATSRDVEGRYLQVIAELGDDVASSVLREELDMSRGQESRLATTLEEAGCIENTGSTTRRRRSITSAGRARLKMYLAATNPALKEGTGLA